MPVTPLNLTNIQQRIDQLQGSKVINPYSGNPTTVTALAVILDAIDNANSASSGVPAINGTDVLNAIDGSLDIESIKNLLANINNGIDLSGIRSSLISLVTASTKRYTGTVFKDANNIFYLNRYNENDGTFANINLATGLVFAPVQPVSLPDSSDSHLVSQKSYEVRQGANSPFYSPTEQITKIVSRINGLAVSIWVNDSRGVEIPSTVIVPATDVQPVEDFISELLAAIDVKIDQIGGVYLDGAYAGTTYYKAITNNLNSGLWQEGDVISRRDVTVNGALTGGATPVWYNETQGQPVDPEPVYLQDIEELSDNHHNNLVDALSNLINNQKIQTAPNNATPSNNPTSRDVAAGIVGLDVLVQNVNPLRSDVLSLPGNLQSDIAAIAANTAKISVYEFTLAQDTNGVVFFIRTNKTTGASNNVRVDTGLPFVPALPIEMTDPVISDRYIETNEYNTITTNGVNWVINDILTRVRVLSPSTGTILSTYWQKADGATLATIPVIGADVEDTSKTAINIATATLNTIGNSADVSLAASLIVPATMKGLTRATWNTITSGFFQVLTAITNGFDIAKASSSPAAVPAWARLAGGVFNAAAPALTNGQSVALQVDASGKLLVASSGGGNSAPGDLFVAGGAAAFNTNTNILLPALAATEYDTMIPGSNATYRSAFVEITGSVGITNGSVTFEGTNSLSSSWRALVVWDEAITQLYNQPQSSVTIGAGQTRAFQIPIKHRYIRCRISTAFAGGTIQANTRFSMDATHYQNIVTLGFSNQSIGSINGVIPGTAPNSLGKGVLGAISSSDTLIPKALGRVDFIGVIQGAITGVYTRAISTRYGSQYVQSEDLGKSLFSVSAAILSSPAAGILFFVVCPAGRQLIVKKLKISPIVFGNYSNLITLEVGTGTAGGAPAAVTPRLINNKPGTPPTPFVSNATAVTLTSAFVCDSGLLACSLANNIHSEYKFEGGANGEIILTAGQVLAVRSSVALITSVQVTAWITDEPA